MMKNILYLIAVSFVVSSCSTSGRMIERAIDNAASQYTQMTEVMKGKVLNPRTTKSDGAVQYTPPYDWTSGFYPGSMWYLYELTGDKKWMPLAEAQTKSVESAKTLEWHHDIGFIIECSFGNGYRITGDTTYRNVVVRAASSLAKRFRPGAGIIQSWNVNRGWQSTRGWECPVIIDNMMNLELLFNGTKYSGDSTYWNIAVSHADRTLENHFRPDGSCYHVIDYSLADGSVRHKHTAQGYAHESAWSRGQAWAIYGFTVCYRMTGDKRYLERADRTFEFMRNHKKMPVDKIPYWDMDAPNIPNEPRDASSASIIASALYEMSKYDAAKASDYRGYADLIMKSLTSPVYTGAKGTNNNFILMHSVGSIPHNAEIDVPLCYADYYLLEALKRKRELKK